MSRKTQSLFNLTWLYLIVSLTVLQGFILTPLYLKYIPESLYGAWLASGNILSWIAMADPGVSRIMQQRTAYTYGRGETDRLGGVLGTGLFLGSIFALIPLLAIPFSGHIVGMLTLTPSEHVELTLAFKWALLATSLMIAMYQPGAANLGLQRSNSAGISYVSATLTGIAVTYYLLTSGHGVVSIPIGLAARAALMLIINGAWMAHWVRRNLRGKINVSRDELRSYTALSALTFVERIVSGLLIQSDAFFIAKMSSNGSAVIYSLTGRAFDIVRMLSDRMFPAFLPGISHLAGEDKRERLREIATRLMSIVALTISVGAACVIAMNSAFVSLWVGVNFFAGQRLTILFAALTVTNVIFSCIAETAYAIGGVGQVEVMRVVEGAVRIALQLILLKTIGILGLPLGGCLGMLLVSGFWLPRLAAKNFGTDTRTQYIIVAKNFVRSGILMACGLAVWYGFTRHVTAWTWWKFAGCSVGVGIAFGALALAMSPSTREELRRLIKTVSKLRASP
ncbi:MAG: oligosaccharide flippase family protein [Planctomycetota bacterium]